MSGKPKREFGEPNLADPRERARLYGWSEEMIEREYGKPGAMGEKPKKRFGEHCYETDDMVHPFGDEEIMEMTRERARRVHGWTEEQIERAYGKPRSREELERALDEVRERARRYGWPEERIERFYSKPRLKDAN